VEAKSRHRPGILGRAGEAPEVDTVKLDVRSLNDRRDPVTHTSVQAHYRVARSDFRTK